MALLRKAPVPLDTREAYYIVESGAIITLTELENMPNKLVEQLLAYRAVKDVIAYGGEVNV